MTVDGTQSTTGDEFSELARRRRQDAEDEAAERPPDFILSVDRSEVNYVLEPSAIPIKYIDPEVLLELMESNYSATLEPPDLGSLVRETSLQAVQEMSSAERLKRAWALPDASIEFRDGRLPTKYGFIPIREIYIDVEKILVRIHGISTFAEAVVFEVLEIIWRSANADRKYSELDEFVRLKGYATATNVDFGDVASNLLGPRVLPLLNASFGQGGAFAGAFGTRSHREAFRPPTNVVCRVTLDELHLNVSRYDLGTGATYTGLLRFSIRAKDDQGTGRMLVASHLPYDDHVKLLSALREELSS